MGEREALSVAEAAGRGVRGGGCVWLVRDEARGHVIGGSPWARMRAGGGHRPREGMWRRLRAGTAAVEEQHSELMVCGASFGAVVAVILTVLALFVGSLFAERSLRRGLEDRGVCDVDVAPRSIEKSTDVHGCGCGVRRREPECDHGRHWLATGARGGRLKAVGQRSDV